MKQNTYTLKPIHSIRQFCKKLMFTTAVTVGLLSYGDISAQVSLPSQPQNFNNYINWEILETINAPVDPAGLDATLLTSAAGQTFKLDNLGAYYFGNTVNVKVTGGTLIITNNPALGGYQAMHLQVAEGQTATIGYTFSKPLEVRQLGGGVVAPSEVTVFSGGGSINTGALLNQQDLLLAGLSLQGNNGVQNATPDSITAPGGLLWQSNPGSAVTDYTTSLTNRVGGDPVLATIFTLSVGQVPEPSSAMLFGCGLLALVMRRKR